MPSGSYTDGQTKAVACDSSRQSSARGSTRSIQTIPSRRVWSRRTPSETSAMISGVSGAPAQSTTWVLGGSSSTARSR